MRLTLVVFMLAGLFNFAAPAPAADAVDDVDFAEFVDEFMTHCVQVRVFGKSDEGEMPTVGDFAADIVNERPTLLGGYWWDRRTVLASDVGIADRFIRSIEISLPGSDKRWPARLKGRFHKMAAVLVEVLPDAEGTLPDSNPLSFLTLPYHEYACVANYGWEDDEWRLSLEGSLGAVTYNEHGAERIAVDTEGILLNDDGAAMGAVFGDSVVAAAGDNDWLGRGLRKARIILGDEYAATQEALRQRLAQSILEVRFRLRTDLEDESADWMAGYGEDGVDSSTYEVRLPGLVADRRFLFIPAHLNAASIARIEEIEIILPDGSSIAGDFAGACRDYMAVIVESVADLPDASAPAGFSFLNPMQMPQEAFMPGDAYLALPDKGLFYRRRVSYDLGRRRDYADSDRWRGLFRTFRDAPMVLTYTNEKPGSLAFDLEGRLIAVALAPRIVRADLAGDVQSGAGFRPLGHIYESLNKPGALDPTLMPTDAEAGKRMIALGVEWQGMDANTSRLFSAEKATRGGDIGLLVSHVYPDSPAAEMGLKEQDILLRLHVQGQAEPLELVPSESHMAGFSLLDLEDVSVESVQRFMAQLSPPWPSRENSLSRLLTGIGVNRAVRLEYQREGEILWADFTTRYAPPDYHGAARHKCELLGMTVKPITYEVARYFRRSLEAGGVIVYKIEEGGRGGVAGLYPYLLITQVNGKHVDDFDDFRDQVAPFEDGDDNAIEFTVEGFGKTRLVKIEK